MPGWHQKHHWHGGECLSLQADFEQILSSLKIKLKLMMRFHSVHFQVIRGNSIVMVEGLERV